MFTKSVDHSPYFDEKSDDFFEASGFPYFRFGTDYKDEQDEKLLAAIHGKSSEFIVLTNKKVSVYKIPSKKSMFHYAKVTDTVLGVIPGVSDVKDGLENFNDLKGGVKNLAGWATGKNKREKRRRIDEGLPPKKQFKNVEWNLKKPDGLAMVLCYSDRILMLNGFNWKKKFEASTEDNGDATVRLELDEREIRLANGKKKLKVKLAKNDLETFKNLRSNTDVLKESQWTFSDKKDCICLTNS
ncbi:MAG: hypothetical protein HKN54_00835 [Flavobacteriaceae bacterium]|nr:hypothetical protein [Flavobacteriaceae bacterium]